MEATRIKVRAWDKRSNIFVVTGIQFNNTTMRLEAIPDLIMMQYTGLKDRKRTKKYPEGQEIYEGDILKIKEYGNCVVESDGGCCYQVDSDEMGCYSLCELASCEALEVIGNVYQNPELIEER